MRDIIKLPTFTFVTPVYGCDNGECRQLVNVTS